MRLRPGDRERRGDRRGRRELAAFARLAAFLFGALLLGEAFPRSRRSQARPPWVAEEQEGKDLAPQTKVYTKGSAVRIRAIAGLVIGAAWRLVLVASPGPLFPRRVGAFTLRARDELRRQQTAAGND
jgi:hypothetical protein